MADKPSRGLIVYGYGLAGSVKPFHYHIHDLASIGCCGFLAPKDLVPSDNEDKGIVREFAQLLDADEASQGGVGEHHETVPTISERFIGMKAALVTNNLDVKLFGQGLGLFGIELNNLGHTGAPMSSLAFELLKLLGFEDGKTSDASQYDLIFVHLGSNGKTADQEVSVAKDTEFMNNLVGEILQTSSQYSAIRSRLHLSLVMSYGAVAEEDRGLLLPSLHDERNSNLSILFPRQSYAMIGGKFRSNVRKHCPLFVVQWQEAVTRKDNTEMLTLDDFRKNSGSLVIPADRFLYEIAFKLWKAPKYGA
ncbi:hypothetical protein Drorol1_Dr00021513 [Drosera rotundifolia]